MQGEVECAELIRIDTIVVVAAAAAADDDDDDNNDDDNDDDDITIIVIILIYDGSSRFPLFQASAPPAAPTPLALASRRPFVSCSTPCRAWSSWATDPSATMNSTRASRDSARGGPVTSSICWGARREWARGRWRHCVGSWRRRHWGR